jgi:hypothetical protein
MPEGMLGRMWQRVAGWFQSNADHITVQFLEDQGTEPTTSNDGYVRLWIQEGFLAQAKTWGNKRFPALHGGVALRFLGSDPTPFTSFSRPPGAWTVPGAQLDFALTPLLPFSGGTVEVEAALYQASVTGPLATAVSLFGSLAPLLGPPLSSAVMIADKISDGLDKVLEETGDQPVLAVHWTMVSQGGGGNAVRPGHLAVVATPPAKLGGNLCIVDGRLNINGGGGPRQLTGLDYLVLRVECRTERDDWRFPHLDVLIREAGTAYIKGQDAAFKDRRTDAIATAWNSVDLTPRDRQRVAQLVARLIDGVKELGAVPGPALSIERVAKQRLLSADDPELDRLRLETLLAS